MDIVDKMKAIREEFLLKCEEIKALDISQGDKKLRLLAMLAKYHKQEVDLMGTKPRNIPDINKIKRIKKRR